MTSKQTTEIGKLLQNSSIAKIKKKLCGELLGSGLCRDVYVLKQYPDFVVKIEADMSKGTFANVTEWRNYINNLEWKWFSKWLAPCMLIDTTGRVLIQKRVYHRQRKDYPKYIPSIFTDLKLSNFGWIGDDFVCCDYSFFPIYFLKVGDSKMKFAKWWGSLKRAK